MEKSDTAIKTEFFRLVQEKYLLYKNHKSQFDERIIENNRWYKSQYIKQKENEGMVSPVTPFLFNTLAAKHADAMDNYPEPNILEREEADKETAQQLTKILPLQLDLNDFKKTYSGAWWYKLKNGAACYGVFYNPHLNHGLGDIDIKKIDLLNLYWEPGITDIQDSRFLFHTALMDNDLLKEQFPDKKEVFVSTEQIDVKTYDDNQNVNQSDIYKDKSLIIDCYYKKDGKVHLLKYSGSTILAASEDEEANGLYDHGMYPFVFDVMYPDEDSPVGFGLIDIIKNPQLYIDKLDSLIVKNALVSGKQRFMIKDNGGVNEHELADVSRDIIHVAGNVSEENVREFQPKPIHPFILNHREKKIEELKEIAGNRDFQQGGTNSGVTAYSAIVALQQAGEKLSRDMIAEGYEAYKNLIYMCVELIRQFYDLPRKYRAEGENNQAEYLTFDNSGMMTRETDAFGTEVYRRAEFDIRIIPQKYNPYNKVAENQTLMELWQMGIFNPQNIEQSLLVLDCMQFDSKAKVVQGLQRMLEEQRAMQQQQMMQQQAAMQQQTTQMQNKTKFNEIGEEVVNTSQGRMVGIPIDNT